jgi:hypothetical protein
MRKLCNKFHAAMPIRPYLDGHRFDPETMRLMGIAFETTIQALHNRGMDDPPREAIAKAIIDVAKSRRTGPGPSLRPCSAGVLHADSQRPQSSSASRLTAGACGLLNSTQSGERPDR